MKKSILYILFFSMMIFISSCGSGLSEKEKNTIEKFEVEWTANIEFADYFHSEVIKTKNEILKNCCHTNDTLSENSMEVKTHVSIPDLEKLESKYFSIHQNLQKENQLWLELKQKAMTGETEWEEIENKINSLKELISVSQKEIVNGLKKKNEIEKKYLTKF